MINRIIIKNYKSIQNLDLRLNDSMNILVGNNEQGKSTILEAINLALTGLLHRRSIHNELNPFIFNKEIVNRYICDVKRGSREKPPHILIEIYIQENEQTSHLKGTINSVRENSCGVKLEIEFNEEYSEEYEHYIETISDIYNVPIEYYKVSWHSFASNAITSRNVPVKCILIDTTEGKTWNGPDRYISNVIGSTLDPKQRAALNFHFRDIKEQFSSIEAISELNTALSQRTGEISEKNLAISLDISQKNGWESNLIAYLDSIPFDLIGKGEQNSIKLKLSLEASENDAHVVLIEEPENHLSFTNLNKLVDQISSKCEGKQIVLTTHSNYVLNKLGLDKVILINNGNHMTLTDLNEDTYEYFKKLPGYDTLRLLLSEKAILVEGPSDELIVQKAYLQKHNKLPIHDGIDVITVRGLSFKRFLEIADKLQKQVAVVTDNDGNVEQNIKNKYSEYLSHPTIKICHSTDETLKTLEPQLVAVNEIQRMNNILGKEFSTKDDLIKYMTASGNKNECALRIFDTEEEIVIPEYINEAIE